MVLPMFEKHRDQFGDTDIGMKRGSLLYLNEVSQEDIIDNFLSCLWTNQVSFSKIHFFCFCF